MSYSQITVPMSVNGIKDLKNQIKLIEKEANVVSNKFLRYSATYIKGQANQHLKDRYSPEEWYLRTGTLENSWVTSATGFGNSNVISLQNLAPYSAYVEYGTGSVGYHPNASIHGYRYNVNPNVSAHYNGGWFFNYQNQKIFTLGQYGKKFIYTSVYDDYVIGNAVQRLFDEAFSEVHKKWIK